MDELLDAEAGEGPAADEYVADPDKLWVEVQRLRETGLGARATEEKWWQLSWRYYDGDHWVKWVKDEIQPLDNGGKPKLVINHIYSTVQTRRAHLLKNRPIGVVTPASIDEEDRNSARTGDKVIEHAWRKFHVDEKLSDMTLDLEVTGNGFIKVTWDPTAGERRPYQKPIEDGQGGFMRAEVPPDPATGLPPPGVEGEIQYESLEKEIGDPCVEHVPPEEVIVEPGHRRHDQLQKILHRTLKPLNYVKTRWPAVSEDVEPIDPDSASGSQLTNAYKTYQNGAKDVSQLVEVLELWAKPTEEYPEGLYAVYADEKLMEAKPTPKGHDHIPFVKFSEVAKKGYWATSPVRFLLDINKTVNLMVSQQEYNRRMLRPRMMAPHESGLDDNAVTSDDTELLQYSAGYEPKTWSPGSLPNTHIEEKEFLTAAIEDIGGSQDVLRGSAGGEVRSGRMVHYLQEYAGTLLGLVAADIERGVERIGNMLLKLYKTYRTEPEIATVVGKNKAIEIFSFMNSDLEGCGDYVVQAGSALPLSRSEKQDLVMQLLQLPMPPVPPDKLVRMLGMPTDIDETFEEQQIDRDNATEALKKLTELGKYGAPPPVGDPLFLLDALDIMPREYEDHPVKLQAINRFRKGQEYKAMPRWCRAIVDAYADQHVLFMAPMMGGGMGPGGPGGAMGAPGPQDGGPMALVPGAIPPGNGGAGSGSQEPSEGLPPVPPVPSTRQ